MSDYFYSLEMLLMGKQDDLWPLDSAKVSIAGLMALANEENQ